MTLPTDEQILITRGFDAPKRRVGDGGRPAGRAGPPGAGSGLAELSPYHGTRVQPQPACRRDVIAMATTPPMQQVRFPGESRDTRRARALRDRVDDLRDARERIIAAADDERRRIERDLHDGAQQRLVGVALTLGLAEARLESDPASAAQLIAQARDEAQLAVKELRELAHGIHPAVLSDRGLGPALEALATRAPVPVEVSGVPSCPLRPAVEAAAYFVTAEALTNVAKYARASEAFVRPVRRGRSPAAWRSATTAWAAPTSSTGTGLRGLRDRVDALDGQLEVHSPPGGGTTIAVEIPVTQRLRSLRRPGRPDRVDGRQARRPPRTRSLPASPEPNSVPGGRAEVELERLGPPRPGRRPRAGPSGTRPAPGARRRAASSSRPRRASRTRARGRRA